MVYIFKKHSKDLSAFLVDLDGSSLTEVFFADNADAFSRTSRLLNFRYKLGPFPQTKEHEGGVKANIRQK